MRSSVSSCPSVPDAHHHFMSVYVQGHEDGAGAVVDSSDNGDALVGNIPQSTAGALN
jgi:hypothetical protein